MESKELPWTGERLVPAVRGAVALEHLHRYAIATTLVAGLDVLDIASGEGYGSQLLALRARSVVGVDIAPEAVRHAQGKYPRANLSFLEGSCTVIPLPDASVDVVVSFETIEHIQEHEQFMAEVVRVLRKGGKLLISTPQCSSDDVAVASANPFHQRELTRAEFETLLRSHFVHVDLLGQRVAHASVILANDAGEPRKRGVFTGDFGTIEFSEDPPSPTFVFALCSDAPLPAIPVGNFEFKAEPVPSSLPEYACFAQVFADQGEWYNETLSIRQPVVPEVWQTLRFDHLESIHSDPQRKLRIDFIDQPMLVEVAGIRVVREADNAVLYDASSEAEFRRFEHSADVLTFCEGERLIVLATNGDPQTLLPLVPDFEGAACTLELDVRVGTAVPGLLRRLHELADEKQTLADRSEKLKARSAQIEARAVASERRHAETQAALEAANTRAASLAQDLSTARYEIDEFQRALEATRRELEIATSPWFGRFARRLRRSAKKRVAEIRELLFRIAIRLRWTGNLRRLHWKWKLIRQSRLIEPRWYFSRYPDAARGKPDPVLHYLCKGALNGYDPSPLFETRWYLEQNPDVAKSGENPLVHFLHSGGKEGRDPSPLFETRWYLERNPDVAKAGENPLIHFLRSGGKEGRDPNPFFDSRWYLERNPDVAEAGENPLLHYLRSGGKEGRYPNPFFDSLTYLEQHPEVARTGQNPLDHFLRHGRLEGQACPNPDIVAEQLPDGFNRELYLALNPDVAASGLDPTDHFLKHGRLEGRSYAYPVIDLKGTDRFQAGRDAILVVSHEASRTGAPVLTLNVVHHLVGRYNVVVLLLGDGPLTNSFVKAGAAALVSPSIRHSAFLADSVVARLHEQFSFKFALVNSIESRSVLKALAIRFVPVVSLIHEFAAYTRPRDAFSEALFWSSEVVFSANVTLQNALQEVPELDDRSVHILPQGRCLVPNEHVTDEEFASEGARIRRLLRPEGSGDDLVVVLGAGMVQIRKGVDLFIEVAARVVSGPGGGNCRFVWFGNGYNPDADLHYSVYLGDQIRRAGLEKHVIFARETPAIESAYEAADIFLLSSRLDPLPNVAIDALAHGKPVLCFDRVTGIADFLKGHGLGDDCVARYLDTAEMADKILALANSRPLRHKVGEQGREAAASFFNMKDYVSTIEVLAQGASERAWQEKQDLAVILDSGLFRPDFSLPLNAVLPEDAVRWHVRAWGSGVHRRKPFPGFHPGVYLEQHGVAIEGADPTADYIRAGRPEGPWNSPVITAGGKGMRLPPNNGSIAMHVHVFYPDLLPEITARLACNQVRPDLFISVTNEEARNQVTDHLKHYGGKVAAIELVPNRGRDIGSFLTAFGPRILAAYDYVGHIHTKKSLDIKDPTVGKAWFDFLLMNLLGDDSRPMADTILAAISNDPTLGMVFPDDPNVVGWNANKDIAEQLAARIGLEKLPRAFDFPVGTMFWARTVALAPLINLNLQWNDYPVEPLPYDGTLLHAIERLLPLTLSMGNLRAATTNVPGVTR
jgi:glycosyltransferase involved in cell wall biosynthesis/SAM-dependent methyltransferase